MSYQQKDLGYSREKTDAKLRVTMPDGSLYDVPAQIIVDSRDGFYSDEQEDTIRFIREKGLRAYEIENWAAGNMNWDEVEAYAVKVDAPPAAVDFQEGWVNGEKEIVGSV